MAIDLKRNKDSLQKVYNEVVSDNCKTNWAVFGYEGVTPVLKVVESGDGGIEEMADELNSGKIQYAYCRITDPNTALPKYVLINWQGEGAQDSFKLKCTAHIRDIQSFLKTVHVTINARTETDIDEDDIVKRVAKASGANYSFHKEKAKAMDAPAPVGTDYHRVIPTRDIDTKSRDKFWAETEKEEIRRKEDDLKKSQQEKHKAEQERKERELQEAKQRDKKMEEHLRSVQQQKAAERKADALNKEAEKELWEKQQQEMYQDEEARRSQANYQRKERAAEAASVSGGVSSARNFFKQKSVERPDADARRAPPPPRKLKSAFTAEQQAPQEPARREPIPLPKQEAQPEPAYTPESPTAQPESPSYQQQEPAYEPEPEPEPEPAPVAASEPSGPQPRNLLRDVLPPRQDSDEEQEEQNWEEAPQEEYSPPAQQAPLSSQETSPEEPVDSNTGGGDHGQCARALYDYQAADDTEISFDPDDIITNIDQIDAGWWQGFAPDGSYGMFPANYVELME